MLLRELKKVASDCCFNPKKPSKMEKVVLDVGNPAYWSIKAMENIRHLQDLSEGSVAYNFCLREATTLLILTRAYLDEKSKETGKLSTGKNKGLPETS